MTVKKHSIKIIIADDHELYVDGLRNFFKGQHIYEVIDLAYNGEELVRKVSLHRPHLVLTDLRMPLLNGSKAIAQIKKISPATHCIVLSSYDNDLSILEAMEAGAKGYITKNMPKNDLFAALDQVVRGYPYYCQTTSTKMVRLLGNSPFNPYKKDERPQFSETELKVIRLICEEKTNQEIADELFLSIRTIENARSRIYRKLNVRSSAGVAIYAIKIGMYNYD